MGGAIGFCVRHTMDGDPKEVCLDRWTNDFPWRMMSKSFLEQGDDLREFVNEGKPRAKWPHTKLLSKVTRSEYGIVLVDMPTKSCYSANDYTTPGQLIISTASSAYIDEMKNVVDLAKDGLIEKFVAGFIGCEDAKQPLTREELAEIERERTWTYENPRIIPHEMLLADYETMLEWMCDCDKARAEYAHENPKPTKRGSDSWDWELKARDAAPAQPRPLSTMIALTAILSPKALKIEHDRADRYPDVNVIKKWCADRGWKTPVDEKSFVPPSEDD